MRFVVVGAGAIGGTVGARLVRDGHDVLFCDADAEHVAAMNEHGLAIEGPVEELTVPATAVQPDGLPDRLEHVLLAVKSQHTETALAAIAPRLARTATSSRCRTGSTSRSSPPPWGRGGRSAPS